MMVEKDEALRSNLKKIAKEDFGYAMKRFNELGFAELIKKGGGHAAMHPKASITPIFHGQPACSTS